MFRALSSDSSKLPSSILKDLGEEIAKGLATTSVAPISEPAGTSIQLPAEPETSEASSIPVELPEEERALSPLPDKRLRLQCKRKRVTPSVQSSPSLLPSGRTSSKASKAKTKTPSRTSPSPDPKVSASTSAQAVPPEQAVAASTPTQAHLRELELPIIQRSVLDPATPGNPVQSYLHAAGESTQSARNLAHASFKKIKTLEKTLKTSKSQLKSEGQRRIQILADLEEKELEVATLSEQLKTLQESYTALEKDLATTKTNLTASGEREAALKSQWEAKKDTVRSLQSYLLKAKEEASHTVQETTLAWADGVKAKGEQADYRAGEIGRLKAYRIAYVKFTSFGKKIGHLIDMMLCYGGVGAARQLFEQGLL
ncbi:uncharacterized protein LOC122019397 [Zingiber officinale]|uniref:uncharacterized protein LOC122019397 n=1 Tax=Zingiber officinale TaxID=94328 RepID=UPI001C4B5360|nr:uncharacterized protein LOC122019397 [Zingiber officinale]